jgi:maltooligosyltrehalose trehalohydrolase
MITPSEGAKRHDHDGGAVSRPRVWAPRAEHLQLDLGERTADMTKQPGGWWESPIDLHHGDDYAFRIAAGEPRPDPRALWLPSGVHGPARVYDHARYRWGDDDWRGVSLTGSVLYELHVGTFTPGGTFDAAIEKLDHLVDLGIDIVEVLPVASYDGPHGWGYDGVALYAVHEPYGGPDGFKRFVDACHQRGLGVVLDVVYNHVGPVGNYLGEFGPYFNEHYSTPWGPAINYSGRGSDNVRAWAIDNALMWLRDFHVDGLRLDAVHAIVDTRAMHLLEEMSRAADVLAAHTGRPLSLVAESDLNDPRLVTAREAGGYGLSAQWADDPHHALHAALTGERQGYYCDFGSLATLAAALSSPYHHAGTWSAFRGRTHGRPLDRDRVPGSRFVTYLHNHDQIGNRAIGDRMSSYVSPGRLRIGAALLMCSPYVPMLFMGEEWGATSPWQFFTSFTDGSIGADVRRGRREEFATHGWSATDVPDPQDPATFERSILDWAETDKDDHRDLLDWYRRLIAVRKSRPELTDPWLTHVQTSYDEDRRWLVVRRGSLAVVVNLGGQPQDVPAGAPIDDVLLASGDVTASGAQLSLPAESVAIVTLR